jgi:hypothetical protein
VEGEGLAVRGDLVALGEVGMDLAEVVEVGRDELAIDVRIDLAIGEFVGLGGVEGDDVVDLLRHHDDARRGCRAGRARRERRGGDGGG